jgi:hypothetical protein
LVQIAQFGFCFAFCDPISEVSFESESSLREIDTVAFCCCELRQRIVIPSSVRKSDGSAFVNSGIRSLEVASDSSSFRTDGPFLLDSDGASLLWLTINGGTFRTLFFESESTLAELEPCVCDDTRDLELTELPASLMNVHGSAFASTIFATISLDPGNRPLRVIGDFLIDISRSRLIHYFGSLSLTMFSQFRLSEAIVSLNGRV